MLSVYLKIPLRSAEQIQNIFGLRVNLLQNKFKICVMGGPLSMNMAIISHFLDVYVDTLNYSSDSGENESKRHIFNQFDL